MGRARELARVYELVEAAKQGRGGALVVRGEPGIGKSALLTYARERVGGATTLSTRGLEAESDLPFAGLSELLAPVLDYLGDIPAPQRAALDGALARGPAVPGDRFAAYVGVLSLLAAAADESPLLLLVDDAHWLDSASAEALLFVARRLADEQIALLLGVRDGEASRFEEQILPELSLGGLDEEAARHLLAADQRRDIPPTVVERLLRATAGNPLALLELPRVLSEEQLVGRDPLEEPLPLVPSLRGAYLRRIECLPEPTRHALTIAAANETASQREVLLAMEVRELSSYALAPAELEGLVSL